jgi:hypothetical protein
MPLPCFCLSFAALNTQSRNENMRFFAHIVLTRRISGEWTAFEDVMRSQLKEYLIDAISRSI